MTSWVASPGLQLLGLYGLAVDTSGNVYVANTTNVQSLHAWGTFIDGQCGPSNGGTFATAPTTNLCRVGTPSTVSVAGAPTTSGGIYTWTCAGLMVATRRVVRPCPVSSCTPPLFITLVRTVLISGAAVAIPTGSGSSSRLRRASSPLVRTSTPIFAMTVPGSGMAGPGASWPHRTRRAWWPPNPSSMPTSGQPVCGPASAGPVCGFATAASGVSSPPGMRRTW